MRCPACSTEITKKEYDEIYEWYECSKCEGCFTEDEIKEANEISGKTKTPVAKVKKKAKARSGNARTAVGKGRSDVLDDGGESAQSVRPVAKGKKRLTQIAEDAEIVAKHDAETLKPRKGEGNDTKHRDEVSTGQILNILADEIEAIAEETGVRIDRLNAREFYAMNIYRHLKLTNGVHFREKEVAHVHCEAHS